MDLYDRADAVHTQEDFVAFVQALLDDLMRNRDAPEWENPTLERFLDAMAAWTEARALPTQPGWGDFAQILAGAKVYE